jgi:MEMO1 family protein
MAVCDNAPVSEGAPLRYSGSMGSEIRLPAVAGRFYPASPEELAAEVETLLAAAETTPRPVIGLMAPHAGYVYSGKTAAKAFAAVEIPRRVIVMCPNHTGRGDRISVVPAGAFRVPTGDVPIDAALATMVLGRCAGHKLPAAADREAHTDEHAIEVMLPFLQARRPDVTIVPIVVGGLREAETEALGEAIADAVHDASGEADSGDDILVLASSDMNHYLDVTETRRRDLLALEAMLTGDPERLYRTVRDNDISMCGVLPAAAMLAYARAVAGDIEPELIAYATSADAFGDTERVVGYASVLVPPH